VYLVYGGNEVGSDGLIELSNLTSADGIKFLDYRETLMTGYALSGGCDFNFDGQDDLIIASLRKSDDDFGYAYLVFGVSTMSSPFNLSLLDGMNGFSFYGGMQLTSSDDTVACLGDVNGDGIDDIGITGANALVSNEKKGNVYILFGDVPPVLVKNSVTLAQGVSTTISPEIFGGMILTMITQL